MKSKRYKNLETKSPFTKWSRIKKQIEDAGVRDEDEIRFIDFPGFNEKVQVKAVSVFLRDRPAWEITQ